MYVYCIHISIVCVWMPMHVYGWTDGYICVYMYMLIYVWIQTHTHKHIHTSQIDRLALLRPEPYWLQTITRPIASILFLAWDFTIFWSMGGLLFNVRKGIRRTLLIFKVLFLAKWMKMDDVLLIKTNIYWRHTTFPGFALMLVGRMKLQTKTSALIGRDF